MSTVTVTDLTKLISGFEIAAERTTDLLPALTSVPGNGLPDIVKQILEPVLSGIIGSLVELLDTIISLLEKIQTELEKLQDLLQCGLLFIQFHEKLLDLIAKAGESIQTLSNIFEVPGSIPGIAVLSEQVSVFHSLTAVFFAATDTSHLNEKILLLKNGLSGLRSNLLSFT